MNDDRSPYQIAIDFAKKDYDFYSKQHDERKARAAEITLEALDKLAIPIQPKGMFKDGECPICGSEEEYGLYCSECGQRINEERIESEGAGDEKQGGS